MSKPVDAWRTASMKLKAPFGQLSPKDKKMNVMEAFKDQKERGLKDEVSDFFTETSFTALVRIYKATSLAKRLMWTLMVLFMVSWLVVQCYWLLDKYFKYPIEVKMDFTSANQLEFPSVTVCNLNPILESKLGDPMFESLNKYKTIKTEDTLYQQTIDNWHFSGSCESSQHQCSNGQCIEMHWVCDGYDDCSNGDDEAHCDTWSCTSSQFKCNDNKCIPKDWECDRYNDCSEGEDEPTTCVYATTPSYMRGSSNPSISHSSTFTTPSGTDKTADETGTTTDDTGTSSGDTATTIDDTGATTEEPDTTTDDTDTTTEDTDTTTEGPNTTTEGPDTTTDDPDTTTEDQDTTTVETHQSTTAESETTTPDSMPGKKRRKRREVMDEMMDKKPFPEHGDAGGPDSPRFFRDLLDKLEMKQAMMKEDTKARLEYQHFVRNNIRPLLKERRDSMADIRRMEESLQPLLRKKRSEKASRTVEEVDWAQVLTSSDFNRWDSLTGNDSNAFYTERDEEYEATMTYAYITAVMDEAEVEPSGHAKNDFIASCKFGGYQCSPQNFTYFHNYKYGNCFTFNTIGHNVDLYTKFPGPSNGLILELFLDSDEYVANLSPGKGARVTVHKKGTSPFPEDEGFSVISGLSVNIGMRQVKMSRVSPPYGACKDLGETEDYYMTRKGFDYSKLSCLKSCYQDIILDFCNCQTPLYFVRPDLPVCNLTNVIVDNCVLSLPVLKPLRYTECDEKCPVPCSETKYETSFSMAQWPTQKAEPFIKQRLAKSNAKYAGVDEIQEEFTRVQIYFVDLMYQYVEQQKAYESMNLISDLGGQLGLWLGLSAITLGELCSFMFSLGRSLPHMCCNANNKKGVVEPSNRQPATLEDMYNEMRLKDLEDAPEVVTTDTSVFTDSKKTPG